MAILKMKRLTLAVVRSQKKKLLEELLAHGCVQFSILDGVIQEAGNEIALKGESTKLMEYKSQLASLNHAIALLNKYAPAKSSLMSAKPELNAEDFLDEKGLNGSIKLASEIEENDDRIKRINAEQSRNRVLIESLAPWESLGMNLECTGTEYTSVILGTIPIKVSLDEVVKSLEAVNDEIELTLVNEDKQQHYVAIICLKEKLQAMQEALRPFGYTASNITNMNGTARECLTKAQTELDNLEIEKEQCKRAISCEEVRREDLKLAVDKLSARVAMAENEERLLGTEATVMMQGWVPAENVKELEEVFEKYDCAWETRDPEKDEFPQVPVKLKNNALTNGLNMVTNMYSLPMYGTVDPNPLMAPFFILFYGLMMADMGYGIIMILAAIFAMKKLKPRDGTKAFCQLLLWGGISTFIAGAATGSFFSDIPYQLAHIINPQSTWQGLPKLFSPTENSIGVLIGALVLGVLHLNTGMVISFVQKIKAGEIGSAIWEEGSLWVVLITGIMAYLKIGTVSGLPIPLIAGILMLLLGAGREAKGFGKVTAAFGCIYNTATGWFGDILSYSRIMALMLAGGVVGQVFNTVAIMPMQSSGVSIVTIVAFALIFLLGHAMNFGLNLLGCYVHDLRLQCLEFFGKFYADGGKAFTPMTIKGKYNNAKQ